MASEKLAYRVDEFCAAIGIGPTSAYKYIALGTLPTIRVGRRTLIPASVVGEIVRGERVLDPVPKSTQDALDITTTNTN